MVPFPAPIPACTLVGMDFQVARDASSTARHLCEMIHGDAPEIDIVGSRGRTLAHVPSHVFYMMVELLKNSLRAVCWLCQWVFLVVLCCSVDGMAWENHAHNDHTFNVSLQCGNECI